MPWGMGRATTGAAIFGALLLALAPKVDPELGGSGGRGVCAGGITGEGAAAKGLGAAAVAITGDAATAGRATSGGGDDSVGLGTAGVTTGICRANGGVEGSAVGVAGAAGVTGSSEGARAAAGGDITVVRSVSVAAGFRGTAFGVCTTSVRVGTKRGGVRGGCDINSLSAPDHGA